MYHQPWRYGYTIWTIINQKSYHNVGSDIGLDTLHLNSKTIADFFPLRHGTDLFFIPRLGIETQRVIWVYVM